MARLVGSAPFRFSPAWCLIGMFGLIHCDAAHSTLCPPVDEASPAAAGSSGSPGTAGSTGSISVALSSSEPTSGRTAQACSASGPPLPTKICDNQASSTDPRPVIGATEACATTCTTSADCAAANAPGQPWCRSGLCQYDECLTDGDCAAGEACACSSELASGNARPPNLCVPATCRVNADCPSGVCAASRGGRCNGLQSYECQTANDTCHSNQDCCGDTTNCSYQPTLGHWACQASVVCNG